MHLDYYIQTNTFIWEPPEMIIFLMKDDRMIRSLHVFQSFVDTREKAVSEKHNYHQTRANINLEQFSSALCK